MIFSLKSNVTSLADILKSPFTGANNRSAAIIGKIHYI
jgi:hypothetical protein